MVLKLTVRRVVDLVFPEFRGVGVPDVGAPVPIMRTDDSGMSAVSRLHQTRERLCEIRGRSPGDMQ